MAEDKIEKWETKDGVVFLRKIGLKRGDSVLDFGCRVGHYTIPAAKVVGSKGIVYAVDKEQEALDALQRKATSMNLKNIKVLNTFGSIRLKLKDNSVDIVLLYDVLHYFDKNKRKELYEEVRRVLKHNGLLSVYPKHTMEDTPLDTFGKMGVDDVKNEIEGCDFVFEERYCGTLSHDDSLNQGCVLNFRKKRISN